MKKSLLTLAVAAGMVASGAAFAEAKVYGHAQVEVGVWGGDADGMSVEDNARGRVGFKASEDLGDGMKALAKFEFKVDTADGDSGTSGNGQGISLQKRELMVGLKTGMGTVELGRLKTAYKYTGGVKYDPYVATILEARGNNAMSGGTLGHNGFISDSVGFINQTGAITFWITRDFDDGGGETQTNATGTNPYTLSVKFAAKDYEAFFAMADADDTGTKNYSAIKLGGQFKVSKELKLSGQYEMTEKGTTGQTDTDNAYLDVQYKISSDNTLDFAYGGQTERTTSGGSFMRLAVKHGFSKDSTGWIGFRTTDVGKTFDYNVIAVGLQNRF